MKETRFIEQNKEKWAEYEQLLREDRPDPERLSELFVQITDDLSYARTFYPNRSVRVFLNSMASRIFQNIYRGKSFPGARIMDFWKKELPQALWEGRMALLLSFCIFTTAFVIGVVSSMIEPEFARTILGDDYVTMTLTNIERGDPMAVYKDSGPLGMTAGIAANNLFVAFRTAILGVLASLGTVLSLLYNGVMVGAFQYFFISKGLFSESFLTIWIHGTLEISAIIIAGASGLIAGSGLLFPGTYRRIQAFQTSIRRGLKIFLGVVPVLVLAAVFEGFLTRYTETPDILRGLFIMASLIFVLWYFVFFPFFKWRRGEFSASTESAELPADEQHTIRFNAIKTPGEILGDAILIMRRHGRASLGLPLMAAAATALGLVLLLTPESGFTPGEFTESRSALSDMHLLIANNDDIPFLFYFQCAIYGLLAFTGLKTVEKEWKTSANEEDEHTGMSRLRQLLVYAGLVLFAPVTLYAMSMENSVGRLFMCVLTLPLMYLVNAVIFIEKAHPSRAVLRAVSLLQRGGAFITGFWVIATGITGMILPGTPVWATAVKLLQTLIPFSGETFDMAGFIAVFPVLFVLYLFLFFWSVCGAVVFYSAREIEDARYIHKNIGNIGQSRQIRGLPKE
ncbi:MAG: stage II sporulation protein M [Bacteroidota bacterium]